MVSIEPKCVYRKSQYRGLAPGAQWGSYTPNFTPRSHLIPDRLNSRWRGALHRRTRSWLGAAGGVGSGVEALKDDLGLSPRKRPKETLWPEHGTWAGQVGLNSNLCAIHKVLHSN